LNRRGAETQRGIAATKRRKRHRLVAKLVVMKTPTATDNSASNAFIQKFSSSIIGVLSGFDRLRFRGTLRQLYCPRVMESYLSASHILLKDFGQLVQRTSEAVKARAKGLAEKTRRPFEFVSSSQMSKEEMARKIAARDHVTEGLICILNAVEPCYSFNVRGNHQTKKIELRLERRKCSHFYFYFDHPQFGFLHLRLQTWFPFQVNLCLNGRHWLARQFDQAGIAYQKKDNTFLRVADLPQAQALLNKQLQTDWPKELTKILTECHPLHRQICRPLALQYYWSASDTEYATDVMFKDPGTLAERYPSFVHHAMSSFSSPDVLRFLGRYVPLHTGKVYERFTGQIISDSKERPEGVRVKHSADGNSIKFYDKAGAVLRVETTIVHPEHFKTYRRPEGRPKEKKSWRALRRGLADLPRRAEVSHRANERYLQALANTSGAVPLFRCVEQACKPIVRDGRRYRALNPWSPEDAKLLQIINRGEFALNGFRNRDVRALYFQGRCHSSQLQRRSAQITRRLGLLRAHRFIQKVAGTHRYILTPLGRTAITALLSARKADVEQLTKMAA
jgi:hypothetical protein